MKDAKPLCLSDKHRVLMMKIMLEVLEDNIKSSRKIMNSFKSRVQSLEEWIRHVEEDLGG